MPPPTILGKRHCVFSGRSLSVPAERAWAFPRPRPLSGSRGKKGRAERGKKEKKRGGGRRSVQMSSPMESQTTPYVRSIDLLNDLLPWNGVRLIATAPSSPELMTQGGNDALVSRACRRHSSFQGLGMVSGGVNGALDPAFDVHKIFYCDRTNDDRYTVNRKTCHAFHFFQ